MIAIGNGEIGNSRSVRRHGALEAELAGALLLRRAIAHLAHDANITPREARAVLELIRADGAKAANGPTPLRIFYDE